ncbi:MAG: FAD-binding oxidoreductase [bacterium]|nr:FAD-binding oxidoreductase [bacterium]
MSSAVDWREQLQDDAYGLMQEKPYPVAAPLSLAALAEILQECVRVGWRVLPLGSGSSFPANFALRNDRTFAISMSRLRDVIRLESGRVYCQAGAPLRKVLLLENPVERKTIGGLLCGTGDMVTRNAARELWQRTRNVVVTDAKGRINTLSGPAAANYSLSHGSSLLVESRGKAGIVVGLELDATELPVELGKRSLCAASDEQLPFAVSRQVSLRTIDATSLFDW